jgi:hypothetical protein
MQMNCKKNKINAITDLKNKLQLDAYRRNALITL